MMGMLTITDRHPYSAIYVNDPEITSICFDQTYRSMVTILPINTYAIKFMNSNTSIQLTESNEAIRIFNYTSVASSGIRVDFTKMPGLEYFFTNDAHVPTFMRKVSLHFQNCNMNRIHPRPKGEFKFVELLSCTQTEPNLELFGDMEIEYLTLRSTFFNDIVPTLPATLNHLRLEKYVAGFTNLPHWSITFTSTKDYRENITRDEVNVEDLQVGPNFFHDIDQYYRKYPDTPEVEMYIHFESGCEPVQMFDFFKNIRTELANDVFNMNVIEHNIKSSARNFTQRITQQVKKIENLKTLLDVGDIRKSIRGFLKGSGEYRA